METPVVPGRRVPTNRRAIPVIKRSLDIALAITGFVVFAIPMAVIAASISMTSGRPILYWSDRVGQRRRLFSMPKFRTMRLETPEVATHLLDDAGSHETGVGRFLRPRGLDELPQLWSVLKGDMSFVGPRPALHSQDDLMELRGRTGVDGIRPGITGWAQISGGDNLTMAEKVALEEHYLSNYGLVMDLKILFLTAAMLYLPRRPSD